MQAISASLSPGPETIDALVSGVLPVGIDQVNGSDVPIRVT
jgi:hypothetical protein